MKHSIIFSTALKYISPLLWVFAIWIYWRGHNLPGGGFIGGLVAACNLSLSLFNNPQKNTWLKLLPFQWIGIGLSLALLSSLVAVINGMTFMKGVWTEVPLIGNVGTPMLFDLGVFIVVMGFVLQIIVLLLKKDGEKT